MAVGSSFYDKYTAKKSNLCLRNKGCFFVCKGEITRTKRDDCRSPKQTDGKAARVTRSAYRSDDEPPSAAKARGSAHRQLAATR
jgi:hypothetical protein